MILGDPLLNFDWLATVASAWLLNYVIHSTVLLTLVWAVSRRSLVSPGFQDVLWKTALVGGLVTATVAGLGHGPLAGTWRLVGGIPETGPVPMTFAPGMAVSTVAAPTGTLQSWIESVRSLDWRTLVLGIWLAGAALGLLGVLAARLRLVRTLGRRAEATPGPLTAALDTLRREAGVRRPVRLTISDRIGAPVALGRSEICLPPRAVHDLDPEQQRNVLAHELAHLVRRDPTWRWVGTVMERLFFFQPLNRIARNGMNDTAEFLCDDWAVRRTGQHVTLAKCLLEVAGWLQPRTRPVHLSGMSEPGSPLVRRVERLLSRRPRRDPGSTGPVLAGLALLAVVAVSAPVVTAVRPAPEPLAAVGSGSAWFNPPIPVRSETLGLRPYSGDRGFGPAPDHRIHRHRIHPRPLPSTAPEANTFVFEVPVRRALEGSHVVTFTPEAARIQLLHRNLEVIGTIDLQLDPRKTRVFLELLEQLEPPQPPSAPSGVHQVPVIPAVEQSTFRLELDVKALRELRTREEMLRQERARMRTLIREVSIRRTVRTPEPGWRAPGWI